jgi:hypothetical protein
MLPALVRKLTAAARLGLILAATAAPAIARSISWGSSVGAKLFDSSGVKLGDTFMFEIGSFNPGFVPDASNLNLWAANWKVFDHAQAPGSSGWNSAFGYIASSANLNTNGTSSKSPPLPPFTFSQGEQGYLWAFNTQTYGSGAEWALITNNSSDGSSANDWLFPLPADQVSQALDWRLSNASAVLFGGLNNVEGSGSFTSTPATFDLQTHQVVPEPGTGLLTLIAALAFWARPGRRR